MPRQPARSTPSTAHCQVRFVNNSNSALQAIWLDYQGGEVTYATLQPCTQHIQGWYPSQDKTATAGVALLLALLVTSRDAADTYVTHPWILRQADNHQIIIGSYCGPDATVEVNQQNFCVAQPGVHCPIWPGSHMWPAHWGQYSMRAKASGIQIMVCSELHSLCTKLAQPLVRLE